MSITLQAQLDSLVGLDRPKGFEIGTLTRYDVPDVAALYLRSYPEGVAADSMAEAVEETRMAFDGAFGRPVENGFIGAWQDGELIGAVFAVLDPPWDDIPKGPFVTELFVDPNTRGRGVATALLGELAKRCAEDGYDQLALRLDIAHADAAKRLYDYLGFNEAE